MDVPYNQQIRAAQAEIAGPVATARFRDALILALAPKMLGEAEPLTPEDYAGALLSYVDALMAERSTRVATSLADLEAWAKNNLRHGGIAIVAGPEALAAALIQRYGGNVEIPVAELEGVAEASHSILADADDDRNVVRFSLTPRPKEE